MTTSVDPGNGLCYLDQGRGVSTAPDWPMADTLTSTAFGRPWRTWGRSVFAIAVVVALATLGIANVTLYSRWHEVEDGVLWGARAEGVTAVEIAADSAAATAGVRRGDVLLAVNGVVVETPSDVIAFQHQAHAGARLTYSLLRMGTREALTVVLAPAPRGSSMYFVLAAVGLFTLLVGASVRLRRPEDQATLHFFWVCVAFFGVFTFSVNGPFDRLDWVFYWGDAIAFALLPPLLLHFTLEFPDRPAATGDALRRAHPLWFGLIYMPAFALIGTRVAVILRGNAGRMSGPTFSRWISAI